VIDEIPSVSAIQQQQAEQMKIYWKVRVPFKFELLTLKWSTQFIEGMLTNLGALPLDRIQSMLKVAPGYNRTTDQLAAFMEAARKEGLVAERDGIWRLSKL
jgi:anaphase-promoting complex subunit 2